MLTLFSSAADVIAGRLEGPIERKDIETYLDRIEASLEANERTHLFIEIVDFGGLDPSDMQRFAGRWLVLIGKLRHFGRIALVTDAAWMRWAAKIESAILPHVSYETFLPAEREAALAWVKGERDRPHGPALRIIETSKADVLGFELDGKVSADELHAVSTHFNRVLDEGRKLRMLGRIRRFGGLDADGLFDREYLAMKRAMLDRLERYAIVGGPAWLASWVKALDPLFKVEIRHFEPEEEALAWAWLGAEPKQERPLVA